MARKEHPYDAYERQQIARAVRYAACYLAGRDGRTREEFDTLEDAIAGAARMTEQRGKFGRQACVYAITPEGISFPIGDKYKAKKAARLGY